MSSSRYTWYVVALLSVGNAGNLHAKDQEPATRSQAVVDGGIVHVPAFDLPPSKFLSAETRTILKRQAGEWKELRKVCPSAFAAVTVEDVVALRSCLAEHEYPPVIARHRARYRVAMRSDAIGGVRSEIITPVDGVSAENRKRVLINLHGGGFILGGRWIGQIESIPIAALARIKVVSVDYRMAPEHQFPAASEDVEAVYKALLREHRPQDIGIYGCSAGGSLTAQAVAWFQKRGLPAPGAIGMLCAGAAPVRGSDSAHFSAGIAGVSPNRTLKISYLRDADRHNPLAVPWLEPQVMARFPASLLITATRDPTLSSVVATHSQLVRLGVKADLHVWEGLGHAFLYEPDLPESREAYEVIVRFFAKHLGQ
jgi:epsilon-lactone hydrolase